jgi:hypothetical protein
MGLGGPKKDMAILMNLNHNGQAMTLSRKLFDKGVKDATGLAALIAKEKGEYTFAQTFPTGTHAMWLYYWLASYGVHPFQDVKTITVPPPQMVANMRVGNMDGYCVGEPWPNRAVGRQDRLHRRNDARASGKTTPRKALGTTGGVRAEVSEHRARHDRGDHRRGPLDRCFARQPAEDREVVLRQVLRQHRQGSHRRRACSGRYDNGIGKTWDDKDHMKFHNDGYVNFPYLSDGMWFMTQTAAGACSRKSPTTSRWRKGESPRHLQGTLRRCEGADAQGADAHSQADRRRGLGRQGPEEIRRRLQSEGGLMSARPARRSVIRRASAAAPAAACSRRVDAAASAKAPSRATGYRRARAPEWLMQAFAMLAGVAYSSRCGNRRAQGGRIPGPAWSGRPR